MAVTPLMESLAIAVLRGDEVAALALADTLNESRNAGEVQLPPVKSISVSVDRLRLVAYLNWDAVANMTEQETDGFREGLDREIRTWLGPGNGTGLLVLSGVDRIEMYELPPPISGPMDTIQQAEAYDLSDYSEEPWRGST